jgi:hypothetical protein
MAPSDNGWLPPRAERPRDYVSPEVRNRAKDRRTALAGTLIIIAVIGALVFAVGTVVSTWNGIQEEMRNLPKPSAADQAAAANYAAKTLAEQAVKAVLKDPDSATFSAEDIRQPRVPIVCGAVNARNSFGGMIGATRFIVIGPAAEMDEYPHQSSFRRAWNRYCTNAGGAASSDKPPRHHSGLD